MFPYNYIYQEGHIQEKIDWTFQNLQNWSLSRNDTTIFEIETSDRFSIPFRRKRSDFLDDILPVPTYYGLVFYRRKSGSFFCYFFSFIF